MTVIEISHLTKRYRGHAVVDDLSFQVDAGAIYGFLGPNGSGKTTTMGMMLHVIRPSSGVVRLFGDADLDRARRRVGATLETPNIYPGFSGRQNLRIVAARKGVDDKAVDEALALVDLTARQHDRAGQYSLGMRHRLALAGAVLGNPDLVLLDEPTNGLDPDGIRLIREVIIELAHRGKTVFLSSHLLSEVERVCTHVAVIQRGRLVAQGRLADVIRTHPVAGIRGGDLVTLKGIVETYPDARGGRVEGDMVLVELANDDLAALNQFVAAKGVALSYLAPKTPGLEETFLQLVSDDDAKRSAA